MWQRQTAEWVAAHAPKSPRNVTPVLVPSPNTIHRPPPPPAWVPGADVWPDDGWWTVQTAPDRITGPVWIIPWHPGDVLPPGAVLIRGPVVIYDA